MYAFAAHDFFIVVTATIAGADGPEDMEKFAERKRGWLEDFVVFVVLLFEQEEAGKTEENVSVNSTGLACHQPTLNQATLTSRSIRWRKSSSGKRQNE